MGLLDNLAGGALGQLLGGKSGGSSSMATKLPPVVLGMLASKGASGGLGSLGGLLGKFQSAGLSSQADSWVGQGENQSLDAGHVRQAFSDDELDDIANQAGVSRDEAAGGLADLIPGLVDGLTPEGSVPDDNSLQGRITDIGKMFGG